jgi:hypothetical protein
VVVDQGYANSGRHPTPELLRTPYRRTSENTHLTWCNAPKLLITPIRPLIAAVNRINKPKN